MQRLRRAFGPVLLLTAWTTLLVLSDTRSAYARPQQPALDPQGSVAVIVTYVDGRRVPMTVGPTSGGAWTSTFPRVAGWAPPANEVPVGAIDYVCARTGEGVRVAIGVFRGSQRLNADPITTVLVTPDRPVIVDKELRAVGVEAVTLTVAALTIPDASLPTVITGSPDIEVVSLSMVEKPVPRYRLFLANHSAKAVRSLEVRLTRGDRPMSRTKAADDEGQVLMAPGASVGLQLQISTGRAASSGVVEMAPADRIVVTGLLWADGSFAGDPSFARDEAAFYYGQRRQLARVIGELERARGAGPGATVAGLRTALGNLPVEASDATIDEARQNLAPGIAISPAEALHPLNQGLSQMRTLALRDLTDFESGPPLAGAFQAWLKTEVDRYQRWHDRLVR
jgi:hypothetical protein